jgi:hypothetical protein
LVGWPRVLHPCCRRDVFLHSSPKCELFVHSLFRIARILRVAAGRRVAHFKECRGACQYFSTSLQIVDRGLKSFPPVIDHEHNTIQEFHNFDQIVNFGDAQDFCEGEPVVVTATIELEAKAIGGGSHMPR